MDLKEYRVDLGAEVEGVWTPVDEVGTSFLIARWNNPRHARAMREKLADNNLFSRMKSNVDDKELRRLEAEILADTILLGWRGLKDNGIEIEYSRDRAVELMGDPSLDQLKNLVLGYAQNFASYRVDRIEEDKKKSLD